MLFRSPIVFLLSLYVAVIYGYLYLLFTTISAVFEGQYGFSQGSVGLSYLGIGVGSFIGLFVLGSTSDRLLKYLTEKNGTSKPEYRLPAMIPGSFFVPIALFVYGWTAYYKVHWIVPIIGTSFLGVGMLITFVSICLLDSSIAPSFILTTPPDDCQHIPCRCIHHLRRLSHGSKHRLPISSGCFTPTCWSKDVRDPRTRLGQFCTGFHCPCSVSAPYFLLDLRRADSHEQTVPSGVLAWESLCYINTPHLIHQRCISSIL